MVGHWRGLSDDDGNTGRKTATHPRREPAVGWANNWEVEHSSRWNDQLRGHTKAFVCTRINCRPDFASRLHRLRSPNGSWCHSDCPSLALCHSLSDPSLLDSFSARSRMFGEAVGSFMVHLHGTPSWYAFMVHCIWRGDLAQCRSNGATRNSKLEDAGKKFSCDSVSRRCIGLVVRASSVISHIAATKVCSDTSVVVKGIQLGRLEKRIESI